MYTAQLRYELQINGDKIAVSGVGEYGVLTACVSWVRRSPSSVTEKLRSRGGFDEALYLKEQCEVMLTGLNTTTDQHVDWGRQGLRPGDVVTIRILGPGNFDTPTDYPDRPPIKERDDREIYEESKRIYLELKSKYEPGA